MKTHDKTLIGWLRTLVSTFLFADIILLAVPTVTGLQLLITTCERKFKELVMRVNGRRATDLDRDFTLSVLT